MCKIKRFRDQTCGQDATDANADNYNADDNSNDDT